MAKACASSGSAVQCSLMPSGFGEFGGEKVSVIS